MLRDSSGAKATITLISLLGCLFYLGSCDGTHRVPFVSFFCYFVSHALLYTWVFRISPVLNAQRLLRHNACLNSFDSNDLGTVGPAATDSPNVKNASNPQTSIDGKRWLEFLFSTTGVVAIAIVVRMAFFSYPLSDDVNRYAWEGLIQNSGVNPYLHSPEEFSTEFTYDPIYRGINHKDFTTIYPPLSLLIFRGISAVFYTAHWPPSTVLLAYKIFFIVCDILVVLVLAQLLKEWGKAPCWLALYAWNPLVILYGSGEGHIDILQNVFIALTLLHFCKYQESFKAGFFFLGCAVMSKYLSIVLLPFVVTRKNFRNLWMFFIPFLCFLFYWSSKIFTSLVTFAHKFHYNDVFPRFVRLTFDSPLSNLVCMSIFLSGLVWVWLLKNDAPERAMGLSWMWTILCLPTVHPWYLMSVVIFLLHSPSRSWFMLSATMGLNFWVYNHLDQVGNWVEFPWLFYGTYLPFLVTIIYDFGRVNLPWYSGYRSPATLDIVVPTLDEGGRLRNFLDELRDSIERLRASSTLTTAGHSSDGHGDGEKVQLPKVRIYVVDGGSRDNTVRIAAEYNTEIIKTNSASRGHQFLTGIQAGKGEVILMLHADAMVNEGVLEKLFLALRTFPTIQWGILGHSYDTPTLKMRAIELSNRLRFALTGIAFGDQGIFVRRHLLNTVGGMPSHRLMEDVELSLRLAPFICRFNLGDSLKVSARRWKKKTFTGYTLQVLVLVISFLILRRVGVDTLRIAEKLYRIYYGKRTN